MWFVYLPFIAHLSRLWTSTTWLQLLFCWFLLRRRFLLVLRHSLKWHCSGKKWVKLMDLVGLEKVFSSCAIASWKGIWSSVYLNQDMPTGLMILPWLSRIYKQIHCNMISRQGGRLLRGLQLCKWSNESNSRMSSFALAYERFGEPGEVLQKVPIQPERTLRNSQVLVKYIASPINPADINTIQGVYPLKPASFPAIGGNEGVAEVLRVGPNVKGIQVGDKVIPAPAATGTWTTHRVLTEKDFIVLDKNVDPLFAAQITVNPCTAYRMLQDFVKLQEGTLVTNLFFNLIYLFFL